MKHWSLAAIVAFAVGCESPDHPTGAITFTSATLTIQGQVTEPAAGAPVEGAIVCWWVALAAPKTPCTATRADGTYAFVTARPEFPPTVSNVRLALVVHRQGFDARQSMVPYDFSDRLFWSPGLQRTLRIEAGRSISGTVYPQEGSGTIDTEDDCEGCKRISITAQSAGELTVRLTAERDNLRLALPSYDRRSVDGPIAVQAGEVVIVLVTGSVAPTRFELSTSFAPKG